MELRHLEYFVAVAEERNFTRAAARVHVVQSAVSATIKVLERELGTPLLERDSKRVNLTDAGIALLPKARLTLDAARDAREAVSQVRGGLRGTLRIGTLTSVDLIDLPALLGEFHRLHPGVQIQLSVAPSGSQGLVDALTERRLDLAFASIPGRPPTGVTFTELARSPIDLVIPDDHPLAERESVFIEELAGLDFIDFPVGYGNRTVVDRAFTTAAISRNVAIQVTDISTGADYVRHGLGIALLPRFIIGSPPGLTSRTVTGADLQWPLSLATSTARTSGAAVHALIELLQNHLNPTHAHG